MTTAELYLYCLFLISFGIFLWALQKPERLYQFPFTVNAIFFAFIIPQCVSLYISPGPSVTQTMVERYFLMACLCLFMSWLGYQVPASGKRDIAPRSFSYKKLARIGIFFVAVACAASFALSLFPTGRLLTGPATICIFFRRWVFYGFAILLLCALKKGFRLDKTSIFLAVASCLILSIIFVGRREPSMAIALILGSIFYFRKGVVVPRLVPISLVLFILFVNPLVGSIRGILASGEWSQFSQLNPIENAYDYYIRFNETEQIDLLEVRNGALLMNTPIETSGYGYGTGYWDALVKYYVPGQLVGYEFKNSLKFNLTDSFEIGERYNYNYYQGQTFTGIADSFVEFDFFGCFFFFSLAYIYKRIWYAAVSGSPIAQISYAMLITSSMLVVTHGSQRFVRDIVILLLIIFVIKCYCQRKRLMPSWQ